MHHFLKQALLQIEENVEVVSLLLEGEDLLAFETDLFEALIPLWFVLLIEVLLPHCDCLLDKTIPLFSQLALPLLLPLLILGCFLDCLSQIFVLFLELGILLLQGVDLVVVHAYVFDYSFVGRDICFVFFIEIDDAVVGRRVLHIYYL